MYPLADVRKFNVHQQPSDILRAFTHAIVMAICQQNFSVQLFTKEPLATIGTGVYWPVTLPTNCVETLN